MSIETQVACELIRRRAAAGKVTTNFQLQKLIYFCHGWALALMGRPLVTEQFEAWTYGPVLPSVYHTFKVFSSNPIPYNHPYVLKQEPLVDESSLALIDRVLEVFGEVTPHQLSNLSQMPDSPWRYVWDLKSGSIDIPDDSIQFYFKRLANSQ